MKMKSIKTWLYAAAFGILLSSCSKSNNDDNGNQNPALIGDWKFLGMTLLAETTLEATDGVDTEKLSTWYGYHSKNNTGTVKIDATQFAMTGVGYSVDTTVHNDYYSNGTLVDATEDPFQAILAPYSGTVPYKAIGTDSVFFEQGFLTVDPSISGGAPLATQAIGSRISWSNDTMLLKTSYLVKSVDNSNGYPIQMQTKLSQVVKLKK
jgi:hypothetical protein